MKPRAIDRLNSTHWHQPVTEEESLELEEAYDLEVVVRKRLTWNSFEKFSQAYRLSVEGRD